MAYLCVLCIGFKRIHKLLFTGTVLLSVGMKILCCVVWEPSLGGAGGLALPWEQTGCGKLQPCPLKHGILF